MTTMIGFLADGHRVQDVPAVAELAHPPRDLLLAIRTDAVGALVGMHPEHTGDEGLDRCRGAQLGRTLPDGLPCSVLGEVLPSRSVVHHLSRERRVDGDGLMVRDGRGRRPEIVGMGLVRSRGLDVLRSPACDELVERLP